MHEALRTGVSVTDLSSSHLQLQNYLTYFAGHFEEMQIKNPGGFMPLSHVLLYLDKYLVDCGNIDAVVVVDEMPAMAASIAISEGGLRWRFWLYQRSSKRTLAMPLEVLCSMPSSCGTCCKTIRWRGE